jgi:hypothetical protein
MPLAGAEVERSASGRKRSFEVGEEARVEKGREKEEKAAVRLEFERL